MATVEGVRRFAERPRRLGALAVAVCLLAGGAWLATATEPFTWHIRVAVLAGGTLALGGGLLWNRRQPPSRMPGGLRRPGSYLVWAVLVAAVVGFQLHMFLEDPRPLYPTISSLVDDWFEHHPVRTLGFLLWTGLGLYLLRR